MTDTSQSPARRMHIAPADHAGARPAQLAEIVTGAAGFIPAAARVVKRAAPAPEPAPPDAPEPPHSPHAPRRDQRRGVRDVLRGWPRTVSFILSVVLPVVAGWVYLTQFAQPQYHSVAVFSVRSTEGGVVGDALNGLARFTGGSGGSDGAILAAFLEGPSLVERLDSRIDLVRHYAGPHGRDPVFALDPDASHDARLDHWGRMARVDHDPVTGLLELRVRAFSPEMAQLVARETLVESRMLLGELNAEAHADAMALSERELARAQARLSSARTELTLFRADRGIVDPGTEVAGRAAILRDLQAQLAQAIVERDLQDGAPAGPEARRIDVLRNRIAAERSGLSGAGTGGDAGDYPTTLAQHERLTAELDFAQAAYRSARLARDATAAQAARQGRYLAVVVAPTLSEASRYPRTGPILLTAALLLCLCWSIGTLARQAVADRR